MPSEFSKTFQDENGQLIITITDEGIVCDLFDADGLVCLGSWWATAEDIVEELIH
jgi:hypothetical protein